VTPADRRALDEHASALRSHEAAVRDIAPALLAGLPQVYDLDALRSRWSLGRDQVLAALHEYAGYQGERGRPVRIPVEVVLRLDRIIKGNASVPMEAACA